MIRLAATRGNGDGRRDPNLSLKSASFDGTEPPTHPLAVVSFQRIAFEANSIALSTLCHLVSIDLSSLTNKRCKVPSLSVHIHDTTGLWACLSSSVYKYDTELSQVASSKRRSGTTYGVGVFSRTIQ